MANRVCDGVGVANWVCDGVWVANSVYDGVGVANRVCDGVGMANTVYDEVGVANRVWRSGVAHRGHKACVWRTWHLVRFNDGSPGRPPRVSHSS